MLQLIYEISFSIFRCNFTWNIIQFIVMDNNGAVYGRHGSFRKDIREFNSLYSIHPFTRFRTILYENVKAL